MNAIQHSSNGLIIYLPREKICKLTRKLRALRQRLRPWWWDAIRVRKNRH